MSRKIDHFFPDNDTSEKTATAREDRVMAEAMRQVGAGDTVVIHCSKERAAKICARHGEHESITFAFV